MRLSRRSLHVRVAVAVLILVLGAPAGVGAKPGAAPRGVAPRGVAPRGINVTIDSADADIVLEGQASGAEGRTSSGSGAAAGGKPGAAVQEDVAEPAEVPLPLDDGRWEVMCSPPCQRRLPRQALFRITGSGVTTSAAFSLPAKSSAVTLDVETGIARWYWTGAIAAIAGATFLIGSVGPRLALGGSFSTVEKVMAGTGAVLVGGGVPLWWFNRTTVVVF